VERRGERCAYSRRRVYSTIFKTIPFGGFSGLIEVIEARAPERRSTQHTTHNAAKHQRQIKWHRQHTSSLIDNIDVLIMCPRRARDVNVDGYVMPF